MNGTDGEGYSLERRADRKDFLLEMRVQSFLLLLVKVGVLANDETCVAEFFQQALKAG